ncbi:LytR/AlgR family response regulator transcription factor [Paraphotobacterium marinum]|nr:LytTR family DNA-binding domain-containing protein [Paraphotobacterium marinum]
MLILINIINAVFRIILVFDGDWSKFLIILINLIKNYTFLNIYLVLSSWLFYSQIKLLLKNYLGETEIIPQLASDEKVYFIALKLGQEYVIEPESINYVIADGNYMNLHLDEGIFPIRITLEQLARKLNISSFYRINRSTIINARFIKKLDDKQENVLLKNNQVYPISKSRRKFLKENLNTINSINIDESRSI